VTVAYTTSWGMTMPPERSVRDVTERAMSATGQLAEQVGELAPQAALGVVDTD
jgi:hypothetical protein